LTNVVKHADATHVDIHVRNEDHQLQLSVADDGGGVISEQIDQAVTHGHIGLATLQERIRSRAGRLDITSPAQGGTTIQVTIPVNGNGNGDGGLRCPDKR
jgi:two-component system sensor histidine kinase DegS